MNRRSFLRGVGISSASLVIVSPILKAAIDDSASASIDESSWRITGSHFGAFRARREGGVVKELKPFGMDKNPTDMLNGIIGSIYSPSRARYPMIRLDFFKHGEKSDRKQVGDNRFVRVTWGQAYKLLIQQLNRIQTTYGPSALHAGQTGWRQTGQFHSCGNHMQRAIALHGAFVKKVGDYSTGAGQTILPYVVGSTEVYAQGTSWELILKNSNTIILWANDPLKNLQVGWNCETHDGIGYIKQLRQKVLDGSINVISIDPVVSKTQAFLECDQIYVNPQTDVAMMLGIAYEMIDKKWYEAQFVKSYALGFEEFKEYVLGESDKEPKTPEWASKICGVPATKIRELAKVLTTGRVQIMMGWAIQRQQHGEQPYWMAAVLATMNGQFGLAGGGISYGHHYSSIGTPSSGAASPSAFPLNPPEDAVPVFPSKDYKGYSSTIPVARWVDAILSPGKEIPANGSIIKLPPIKMMIFSGNNPFNHHQDRNRMKEAFRQLECVVAVDFNWTATCRHADIVLPACTQFERHDVDIYGSYAVRGVLAMQKLVEPLFESRSDWDIWRNFAKYINRYKEYTLGMDEVQWLEHLYEECRAKNKGIYDMPDFRDFWQAGFTPFGEGKPWVRHADFRDDPEINQLGTPSGMIEIFSRKIDRYGYKNCKGHPTWMEKKERSHGGPGSDKYPLWLQSCHPDQRLHSQLCESEEYRATYTVQGREPLYISPEDAKARKINDGDLVRVFNDRGQLLAGARVSDRYPPGVIRIHEGAWFGPTGSEINAMDTYGDPNTLTLDIGTSDLAQATSAFTCIVEVERWKGESYPVTSFGGPEIIS
ncbi:trimethylamine N-oxide reductase I catalytic subunit [Endozoicomonas sp. (ex Bugula neritina AB1)]|nr:trimethylamine N-oxide reductase I catalytic subunit [Endozoicomonas sp. (ex Bugula neritina AB1)]